MNIDYIINEQRLNIPATVLHDRATSTGNGTLLDISGQDGVIVRISGDFVGTINFAMTRGDNTWIAPTHVYDLESEIRYNYKPALGITQPGTFLIKNIYGYKTLRVRIERYTSGEITVVACSADSNIVTAAFPEKSYIPSTLLMDGVVAVGNSEFLNTRPVEGVLFTVSGTFEARLKVWGQYGNSTFIQITNIYNADRPLDPPVSNITKAGKYYIRNITRFDNMQVRIDQYTSGSVTVRASSATADDIFNSRADRTRQVLLTSMLGVSVGAGAHLDSNIIDVSPYVFVYCAMRTDTEHALTAVVQYRHNGNTLGSIVPPTNLISGPVLRGVSDWIEVKGTDAVFSIYNNSDAEHTYDLFFYGVR